MENLPVEILGYVVDKLNVFLSPIIYKYIITNEFVASLVFVSIIFWLFKKKAPTKRRT